MAASPTAGNFTCAQILKIQIAADKIAFNNQISRDYTPRVGALTAIRAEQTAQIAELQDPAKDNVVKIIWAADCNVTLSACTDDCVIGGPEPESQCQEHSLDLCQQASFSISEKKFRTIQGTREEYVAVSMIRAMKELDEYLAKSLVSKLNVFAGKNQFLGGIGDPDNNGLTYIESSYWTPDIYGYFSQVQTMNEFGDVFMLHGSNLEMMRWQAEKNSVSNNLAPQLEKMNSIKSYWDMFNVDTQNGIEKTSYMISRGAVAFFSKAYYGTVPTKYMTQERYSVESKGIPGVFYDVVYNNVCNANDIKHNWTFYTKAVIALNPLGCNKDVTGVIKFVCGTNAGS